MEQSLRVLSSEERRLKETLRELINKRARAYRSELRKKERIRMYKSYIEWLERAVSMDEDSDGEQQMTDILHKINSVTQEAYTTIDKFIVVNDDDGTSVTVTTSSTIRANRPLEEMRDKTVRITRDITGKQITTICSADWATRIIKCAMSTTLDEIEGRREEIIVRQPHAKTTVPGTSKSDINYDTIDTELESFSDDTKENDWASSQCATTNKIATRKDNRAIDEQSTDVNIQTNKESSNPIIEIQTAALGENDISTDDQTPESDTENRNPNKHPTADLPVMKKQKPIVKRMKTIKQIPRELKEIIKAAESNYVRGTEKT